MSDLVAGDISPEEVASLESHQAGCTGCREELDRMILQDRALAEMAGQSLSDALRERVHQALAKAPRASRGPRLLRWGAAAALLVALAGGALWWTRGEVVVAVIERVQGDVRITSKDSDVPASTGVGLVTGQGLKTAGSDGVAVLRYPDGTIVELSSEAEAEKFSDGAPALFLKRGRLKASVAKQAPGRSMTFSSPQAEAKVLGTRLRLLVEGADSTRLDVEEGTVRLLRRQDGASIQVSGGSYAIAAPGMELVPRPILAGGKSVALAAGETLTLSEDLVLTGQDSVDINGTPERRCVVVGNRHRIRTTGEWTGHVRVTACDFRGVGDRVAFTAEGRAGEIPHAIDLSASREGEVSIDRSTFTASSSVRLRLEGNSTAKFVNNTSAEDSVVSVDKAREKSFPFFEASGNSAAPKLFQGNRVYRAGVLIQGKNWAVGGASDAESNLIIGLRAWLQVTGEGNVVRGNYVHVLMPRTSEYPYWSQVSTFTTAKGTLAEHNVIRDGEWIVQFVEGEFRHNLICDINDHDLLRNGSTGRIHHNIFVAGKPDHPPGQMSGCIFIVYAPRDGETGAEVFNNTFDASGILNVPGVEVNPGGLVKSLRNNVFYNFNHQEKYVSSAQAMIRPQWNEPLTDPAPARLGYSDYNAFYSPAARVLRNYALSVEGKKERKDAGFGLNDLPKGGESNAQVDPKFKGPIPSAFVFHDDDIKSGRMTVSKILAYYRDVYTPAPGSPLIDAGDPADGEGTDIGAVDAGKPARGK